MVRDTIVRWRHDTFRIITFKSCQGIYLVFFLFLFFCPSATWLFPRHPSLFSIFRLLRTFLYSKEERVRWIHTGDTERRKNFISLASFLLFVAFLDKFIVSSEPDGAVPRYHQRLQETNTIPLFLHIWSSSLKTEPLAEFKRSPSTLPSRTTRYCHGLWVRHDTTGFTSSKIALPWRS